MGLKKTRRAMHSMKAGVYGRELYDNSARHGGTAGAAPHGLLTTSTRAKTGQEPARAADCLRPALQGVVKQECRLAGINTALVIMCLLFHEQPLDDGCPAVQNLT